MATLIQCAQCGQTDDHPKASIGDGLGGGEIVSRHLDCLPHDEAEGLRNDVNFGALNAAAIDAAVAGTQGDDLRALLVAQQPEREAIVAATEADVDVPAEVASAPLANSPADAAPTTEKG